MKLLDTGKAKSQNALTLMYKFTKIKHKKNQSKQTGKQPDPLRDH